MKVVCRIMANKIRGFLFLFAFVGKIDGIICKLVVLGS